MIPLTLHEYQERAIDFCLRKRNTLVVMKMGLGKTAVALKVIEATKRPALILGPLRPILYTWPEEINKWTPKLSYTILHGPNKDQKFYLRKDLTLLNYAGLKWFYNKCVKSSSKLRRYILIADESSMLKDPSTVRFTLMKKLQPLLLPVRLLLSATPVDEGPMGLWSQAFLLDNGKRLGKSYSSFRSKYFVETGYPRYITHPLPTAIKNIKSKIQDISFALDNKDYVKMPALINNLVSVQLPTKIMAQYKKLEKDFIHKFSDGSIAVSRTQSTLVNKLRQFISGALYLEDGSYKEVHREKASMLEDMLNGLEGRRTLVAINFKFEVDLIRKVLKKNIPVLHGGTPETEIASIINRWNARQIPVLLCHPLSISHGMNLQSGGNSIIWYTLPWGFGPYEQLIGRLARQNQPSDTVIVQHLLVKNTIDYVVMRTLLNKGKKSETFFQSLLEGMGEVK